MQREQLLFLVVSFLIGTWTKADEHLWFSEIKCSVLLLTENILKLTIIAEYNINESFKVERKRNIIKCVWKIISICNANYKCVFICMVTCGVYIISKVEETIPVTLQGYNSVK